MSDGNQMTVEALGRRVAELESRMEAAEGDLRAVLRVAGLPLARPRPRVSPPPPPPVIPPPLPRIPAPPPPAPEVVDKTPAFPVVITPRKTDPLSPSPLPTTAPPRVARRITAARYAGLTVLGITLLKVFTVDMAGVETIWRILSFMAVGALLLCVSFVYYKHLEGKVATPGVHEDLS